MIQALLALLTLGAFVLATSPAQRLRSIAPLVGIPAQVLWAISINWTAQWGIALVVVVYLGRYIQLGWMAWRPRPRR
jgi:hypothetical protein